MNRVVIVGASLAGLRTAEQLRSQGFGGELILIGAEKHRPYDRPPLSKSFATGESDAKDLELRTINPDLQAVFRLGTTATQLLPQESRVELSDGSSMPYDGLVIATGTTPVAPPGLDLDLAGVHFLRTLDDAVALRRDLRNKPNRVAVIGAGFIGVELASTCRALDIPVTLIDSAPLPLARPLGQDVAEQLLARHSESGTQFRLGASATQLVGVHGAVRGVELSDGSMIAADVVVVGIGVRPATGWLNTAGLDLSDGVLCAADLSVVGLANAVAVGDVSRWPHPALDQPVRLEHWSNAVEGAEIAAGTLLGHSKPHLAVPSFWSDQLGIKIQGVGFTAFADDVELLNHPGDDLLAIYRRKGALIGAVAFGNPRRLLPIRRELSLDPRWSA